MQAELLSNYDGSLTELLVKEGDYIIRNQILGIIQTNNNSMIPLKSKYEGLVKRIYLEKGNFISEGMILAIVEEKLD